MKRKAQIAMESLMMYGIAILIVMLAIGALIYFGVLDLGAYLPDKCDIAGGLKCENYVARAGQVQLELRNNVGKAIRISSVALAGNSGWETLTCAATGLTVDVRNGDLTNPPITVSCSGITTNDVGKKMSARVTVTYRPASSQIDMTAQGNIQVKIA